MSNEDINNTDGFTSDGDDDINNSDDEGINININVNNNNNDDDDDLAIIFKSNMSNDGISNTAEVPSDGDDVINKSNSNDLPIIFKSNTSNDEDIESRE